MPSSFWPFVAALVVAYLLGGLSPGHWLVRRRMGVDVRQHGSGATGATNAARLLGRRGFFAVLLLDALKGVAAVLIARALGLRDGWEFAAATAVIAGHIWPLQLGFRGGKGLGPMLGAWVVLAPVALLASSGVAAVVWGLTGRKVAGGMLGVAVLVPTTAWRTDALPAAIAATVTFVIVAVAHRTRVR
jgi:acyl phosphate:glycerol-3-phosphate acyltransferase